MVNLLTGSALMLAFMMQSSTPPATPPMKMGLWETTSTISMTMSGGDMPGGAGGRVIKVRVCMTPESYQKDLAQSQHQRDCTLSNQNWTANSFSFDISCPASSATGHFTMSWDGDTGHGTIHMDMSPQGHSMTMNSTLDSHYLGADCGSVKPGSPEIQR